jgi:acetylornithine deacetylase/succinyl-diaminopimelate desuccinylase-like protein
MPHSEQSEPLERTAEITRALIRFDTTNYGEGRSNGEEAAADYVAGLLRDLGLDPVLIDAEPGRRSVIARVAGAEPSLPALVVHGHLDVVPAIASDWSVDPFEGVIKDGMIWGRGAVDMKDMDAMILASLEDILGSGRKPRRDLVIAFFSDEEAGGERGSHYVVEHHPELFAGATEAISEVGGYSVQLGGTRAYLMQTGEKALVWLRLTAHGRAGHGSQLNDDNAVTTLAQAVARIGAERWPVTLTATTQALLTELARILDMDLAVDGPDAIALATGSASRFLTATLRNTANPTGLTAGYKVNVIPGHAEALVDVRTLPGEEEAVIARVRELAGPDVEVEITLQDIGLETEFAGPLVEAIVATLGRHDPGAPVIPYLLSGGTDNKALAALGIRGVGFAPLQLPADLDFPALFHGVDERVPLNALVFGKRVLTDLLLSY